ncbi:uncharacterized protein V6R79_015506 [Siganus canaliculatus]
MAAPVRTSAETELDPVHRDSLLELLSVMLVSVINGVYSQSWRLRVRLLAATGSLPVSASAMLDQDQ